MANNLLEQWYGHEKAQRIRSEQRRAGVRSFAGATVSQFGAVELSAVEGSIARAKMEAIIVKLRVSIANARAGALASTAISGAFLTVLFPFLTIATNAGRAEVQQAVNNGLNQMENMIKLRLVDEKENVINGSLDLDRWLIAADEINKGIVSIYEEIGSAGTASNLLASFEGSKADLQDFFNRAAKVIDDIRRNLPTLPQIKTYGALGIIAILAIGALILIPVARAYLKAPLKAAGLSSYRRRQRRLRA